ncbi:MAG TPA: hypothetical protein VK923_12730 [Euzebyales bacterium]|nr:hypothetical protein [Euzebyales bacterium]
MNSEQHDDEIGQQLADDQDVLDELHAVRNTVVAIRAVLSVGEPDHRTRCRDAAAALRSLLSVPTDRPAAWEAEPVQRLEEPLRDVLAVLDGADR